MNFVLPCLGWVGKLGVWGVSLRCMSHDPPPHCCFWVGFRLFPWDKGSLRENPGMSEYFWRHTFNLLWLNQRCVWSFMLGRVLKFLQSRFSHNCSFNNSGQGCYRLLMHLFDIFCRRYSEDWFAILLMVPLKQLLALYVTSMKTNFSQRSFCPS